MDSFTREAMEGFITKAREVTSASFRMPITKIQRLSTMDKGVRGPRWVSRTTFPAPQEDDIRCMLVDAIKILGDGQEDYPLPDVVSVPVQWVGVRSGVAKDAPEPPEMTEQAKYEALVAETSSDLTLLYIYGGAHYPEASYSWSIMQIDRCSIGHCSAPPSTTVPIPRPAPRRAPRLLRVAVSASGLLPQTRRPQETRRRRRLFGVPAGARHRAGHPSHTGPAVHTDVPRPSSSIGAASRRGPAISSCGWVPAILGRQCQVRHSAGQSMSPPARRLSGGRVPPESTDPSAIGRRPVPETRLPARRGVADQPAARRPLHQPAQLHEPAGRAHDGGALARRAAHLHRDRQQGDAAGPGARGRADGRAPGRARGLGRVRADAAQLADDDAAVAADGALHAELGAGVCAVHDAGVPGGDDRQHAELRTRRHGEADVSGRRRAAADDHHAG
nr:hypothetical protein CFP56_09541 [Quercus suber]